MTDAPAPQLATKRRIAGQGAMLFAGFASAQVLSFARNAVLGHTLSKGDFGVAASITLMLQLVETLSDLGSDKLIVQAADGNDRRFLAASHTVLVVRGLVLSALLFTAGRCLQPSLPCRTRRLPFNWSPLCRSLKASCIWAAASSSARSTPPP